MAGQAKPGLDPFDRASLLTSVSALLVYLWTAAPTAYWLDSSEFAAAAFELGISHPPGHPLFVLLGKLAILVIPIGSAAFRVHVMCGAFMALSTWLTTRLCRQLWGPSSWVALSLGLPVLILCVPFWFHGVRAEVYPLNLVISLAILVTTVGVVTRPRGSAIATLGFLTALGAANHHYLIALLGPGVLLTILLHGEARSWLWRRLPHAAGAFLIGLTPYLLLPVRAGAFTTVRWGDASTPSGMLWIVSAQAFHKTAERGAEADVVEMLGSVWRLLELDLGVIVLAASAVGLIALARARWRLALGLLLVIAANIWSQMAFDLDPYNPDVAGYYLPSLALIAALLVGALHAADRFARTQSLLIRCLSWLVLAAVPGVSLFTLVGDASERSDLSDERATDVLADETYAFVPTGGVLVPSYFETSFNLWYREVVACDRPDVAVVHRMFRTYPGYDDYLAHRFTDLAPLFVVQGVNGSLAVDWLAEHHQRHPAVFELMPRDDALATPSAAFVRTRLLPAGPMLRMAPTPPPLGAYPTPLADAETAYWEHLYDRLGPRAHETDRNLVWLHYNRALLLIDGQRYEDAALHVDRGLTIFPNDLDLRGLRRELRDLGID